MKILLVDDHPLVLEGVAQALRRRHHEVVTVESVAEGRCQLQAGQPGGGFDLLMLDFNLPTGKGTELLREEALLPPRVMVLSGMMEADDVVHLLETEPVHTFISKGVALDDLCAAVDQVAGDPGTRGVWDQERGGFVDPDALFDSAEMLSPREREVFRLMRGGLLDKEIADQLGRSIHTVRVQIRAIKRKKNQRRRAMVAY